MSTTDVEKYIPHPRIKGVCKSLGDGFERASLSVKARAKLSHMNKTQLRKFIVGFRYCTSEGCLYCKPGRPRVERGSNE